MVEVSCARSIGRRRRRRLSRPRTRLSCVRVVYRRGGRSSRPRCLNMSVLLRRVGVWSGMLVVELVEEMLMLEKEVVLLARGWFSHLQQSMHMCSPSASPSQQQPYQQLSQKPCRHLPSSLDRPSPSSPWLPAVRELPSQYAPLHPALGPPSPAPPSTASHPPLSSVAEPRQLYAPLLVCEFLRVPFPTRILHLHLHSYLNLCSPLSLDFDIRLYSVQFLDSPLYSVLCLYSPLCSVLCLHSYPREAYSIAASLTSAVVGSVAVLGCSLAEAQDLVVAHGRLAAEEALLVRSHSGDFGGVEDPQRVRRRRRRRRHRLRRRCCFLHLIQAFHQIACDPRPMPLLQAQSKP